MIRWQLPVRERVVVGRPDWVHPAAKFHCFIDCVSLCGKYIQDTDFFETDASPEQISQFPVCACKICYQKFGKMKK